jgi:hypothetical protein
MVARCICHRWILQCSRREIAHSLPALVAKPVSCCVSSVYFPIDGGSEGGPGFSPGFPVELGGFGELQLIRPGLPRFQTTASPHLEGCANSGKYVSCHRIYPRNCRSLGSAPDEQNGFPRKHLIPGGGNCRFLGFARNDKGESSALIGCSGGNNCLWMLFIPFTTCRRQVRVLLTNERVGCCLPRSLRCKLGELQIPIPRLRSG